MLGSFRFLLAWVVMLSHLPFSPFTVGFNPAVSAVIMFYFISGFLMYHSFKKETIHPLKKQVSYFYIKRFLRLFPLYWFVLTITIISIYFLGKSEIVTLLNQDLTKEKILLNSSLILNNYVFDPFIIQELLPHPFIPPTWSLGTELHFYLLVPILFLLLQKESKFFYIIFLVSFIFELVAFSITFNHFNSDNFGYRYILGVLWIFMFGFLFAHNKNSKFIKFIYIFILTYFLFIGFYFSNHPYIREIIFAILFTPLILIIKNLDFKYDKLLGQLSYPIFISHFFIFFIVSHITHNKFIFFSLVFIFLIIFSILLALIQKQIEKLKRKL